MSLMAWFRKNNKKLLAFVVIALMIVFTIQPIMQYLEWRRGGGQSSFATYENNKKIKFTDRQHAQKQLEILKFLKADTFLRPQDPRMMPNQDLRDVLLGELLFSERSNAAETITRVRQLVRRSNLPINDEQIDSIYNRKYPPDVYWIMLTKEAELAGIRISTDLARTQLEAIIPRLTEDKMNYATYVGAITKQLEVSEDQVIEAFADLMSVLEYTKIICASEDRTRQQVLLATNWQQESMDIEYVTIAAGDLTQGIPAPGEDRIKEQFEKYKDVFAADVNDANSYGFGYKLPDRVQLEYIAVEMNDVAAAVPKISQQEAEEFYQQHIQAFAQQVPSDPNDPNSPLTTRIRTYAEVAGLISKSLYQQRVDLKAELILSDAKSITEANLSGLESEENKLTSEQIQKQAVDYEKTAAQLQDKYKVKVYSGKTGLLGAVDVQSDRVLGVLFMEGPGIASVGLVRIVFAVEPLKSSFLGPVDVKPPRLYENIGPLKDAREAMQGYSGKNMMLVRIIDAVKAGPPDGVDIKIDRHTVNFGEKEHKDVNTIREYVIDDLKTLDAMKNAREKAGDLLKEASKDGWSKAIEKLNKYYASINKESGKDSNKTTEHYNIQSKNGIHLVSPVDLQTQITRYEGDPLSREFVTRSNVEMLLLDKFYSLIAPDANVLQSPQIVQFNPNQSYYCVKSLTINRMSQEQYDDSKGREIIRSSFDNGQAMAVVFYNPENILKRMNFQLTEQREPQAGKEEPNKSAQPAKGIKP